MHLHVFLLLLALQTLPEPSSAGEESLIWTELADPDPGYVPPPPTAEEIAAQRAERARAAERRRIDNEYRRAAERADAELRRAEATIQNTCETVRQAIGDHPACSQ